MLFGGGALLCILCVFFFPLFSVISQSLSPDVLDIFNQNAYCCWKGLWGSFWRVAGAGVETSEPLLLFCVGHAPFTLTGLPTVHCTFCSPRVAASWQLTCTHDQLWGTPWPGLIDDLLGREWCWQPVKAQFSGWIAVPELSDYFGESCSQTAACPFAASSFGLLWVHWGSLQASEQQPSVLKFDYALMFHVTDSWQAMSCQCVCVFSLKP